MRLRQTIYLFLGISALIIGVHQTWYYGFWMSYWIFMIMLICLALFRLDVAKRGIPKVDQFIASQPAAKRVKKPKRK